MSKRLRCCSFHKGWRGVSEFFEDLELFSHVFILNYTPHQSMQCIILNSNIRKPHKISQISDVHQLFSRVLVFFTERQSLAISFFNKNQFLITHLFWNLLLDSFWHNFAFIYDGFPLRNAISPQYWEKLLVSKRLEEQTGIRNCQLRQLSLSWDTKNRW